MAVGQKRNKDLDLTGNTYQTGATLSCCFGRTGTSDVLLELRYIPNVCPDAPSHSPLWVTSYWSLWAPLSTIVHTTLSYPRLYT